MGVATSRLQSRYTPEAFCREAPGVLALLDGCTRLEDVRRRLFRYLTRQYAETFRSDGAPPAHELCRVRDCAQTLASILNERSDACAGFSVAQALWDLARGRPREDLRPGFYADLIHLIRGLERRAPFHFLEVARIERGLQGREAAVARSAELDELWRLVEARMARFEDGLSEASRARRAARRQRVLEALGGSEAQWRSWHWQVRHVIKDAQTLARLAAITDEDREAITRARAGRLPFGITPYYASLLDDEPGERDRAVRAQVIPPMDYVETMLAHRDRREFWFDFMQEHDTSPAERITRRYPAIVIIKPYNTCPQICVYCQRNWEIEEAMAPGALASPEEMDAALRWIQEHPAVREVLITGGDPLVMSDERIEELLARLAAIEHVDLVRLGTRTPVTLPMRVTPELAALLGRFREPGRRDLAVVTHVEHPYEITPEMVEAVERLRRQGIGIYNQQVYTFFVSRRFETAALRMLLRRIGVDPYYTFVPKGKEETARYRVPLARLLQERKEEARLLPGLRRTDDPVYNVPRLGKVSLRARQHRDLVSVLADGSRVYEFHPWEKNLLRCETYATADVPILEYLERLEAIGEDPDDYSSIWYYF